MLCYNRSFSPSARRSAPSSSFPAAGAAIHPGRHEESTRLARD